MENSEKNAETVKVGICGYVACEGEIMAGRPTTRVQTAGDTETAKRVNSRIKLTTLRERNRGVVDENRRDNTTGSVRERACFTVTR